MNVRVPNSAKLLDVDINSPYDKSQSVVDESAINLGTDIDDGV